MDVYKHAFPVTCPGLTQTTFWTPLAIHSSSLRSPDKWSLAKECWTHRQSRNAEVIGGLPLLFPRAKIFCKTQSSWLLSYCRHWLGPAGDFKNWRPRFWHSFPSETCRSVQVLQRFVSPAWHFVNAAAEWASIQGRVFRPGSGPVFTSLISKIERNTTWSVCIFTWF